MRKIFFCLILALIAPVFLSAQVAKLTDCKESAVVLETSTGNILGTLATPAVTEKVPLVIIIAGSGPTDRDGNQMMVKTDAYKKLSAALCARGIAVLRYDKRGIGESKPAAPDEKDLRFDHYVSDVKSWVTMFKNDPRFSSVVLLGHSEGSLIGMAAAEGADKFISLSGAGRTADLIMKEQLAGQPEEVKEKLFPKLDSLKAGFTVVNKDKRFNGLLRPSVQPYFISWMKYNPQEIIKKVSIPIMIIQGTTDIQVSLEDARLLNTSNPNSRLVIIEKMNHVLTTVGDDKEENMATYNKPELPLHPELVEKIIGFVK